MAESIKTTSTIDLTFSDRAGNQFTWKLDNPLPSGLDWNTVNTAFQTHLQPNLQYLQSRYEYQVVSLDAAATVITTVRKTTLE